MRWIPRRKFSSTTRRAPTGDPAVVVDELAGVESRRVAHGVADPDQGRSGPWASWSIALSRTSMIAFPGRGLTHAPRDLEHVRIVGA